MSELFGGHKLNETGEIKALSLAGLFDDTLRIASGLMGPKVNTAANPNIARELAIVRTKLEEACFFAKKAMAMQPENQEIPAAEKAKT